MNLVHLIGTIQSEPRLHELPNGRRLVKFTLVTEESYLDLKGQKKLRKNWHNLSAWGRWVQILRDHDIFKLMHVPIIYNVADIGTKILLYPTFSKLRDMIMFQRPNTPTPHY